MQSSGIIIHHLSLDPLVEGINLKSVDLIENTGLQMCTSEDGAVYIILGYSTRHMLIKTTCPCDQHNLHWESIQCVCKC